jgi:hypothetical protein
LISAALGLIGGVVGSLVAPWVQWAVEKRRNIYDYRRVLIRVWREKIEGFDYSAGSIGDTATYAAIRPLLDPEIRKKLENSRTVIIPGVRGPHPIKQLLLDKVSRIERKWGLMGIT